MFQHRLSRISIREVLCVQKEVHKEGFCFQPGQNNRIWMFPPTWKNGNTRWNVWNNGSQGIGQQAVKDSYLSEVGANSWPSLLPREFPSCGTKKGGSQAELGPLLDLGIWSWEQAGEGGECPGKEEDRGHLQRGCWRTQLSQDHNVHKRKRCKAWEITTKKARGNGPWSSPRTRNSIYSQQPVGCQAEDSKGSCCPSGQRWADKEAGTHHAKGGERSTHWNSEMTEVIELIIIIWNYYDRIAYVQDPRGKLYMLNIGMGDIY